jgi:hypothetical protein
MGLNAASLTCDECGKRYEDNDFMGEPEKATALSIYQRARRDSWNRLPVGVFCPRCIARAERGTLAGEPVAAHA